MRLYHGTSYENFLNIMKFGFNPQCTIWNCSDEQVTYFWNPANFLEHGEADDIEDCEERAIYNAFDSSFIAAAFFGSQFDKVVVFEYEADEEDIREDDSCDNMQLACCVKGAKKENITRFWTSPYYPDLRLFYIKGLENNDYFQIHELPEMTQKALSVIPLDTGLYLNETIDPYEHTLSELKL